MRGVQVPITADAVTVVLVFIGCTAVFHAVLVYLWPLGKRGWKIADYVWLGFAAFGLLSAAAEVRRAAASQQRGQLALQQQALRNSPRQEAERWLSKEGLCTAPTTEQRAVLCEWLKAVVATNELGVMYPSIDYADKVAVSSVQAVSRAWLDRAGSVYYGAAGDFLERRSPVEDALFQLGPLLLGVALALRVTKVTGELRLDRVRPPIPAPAPMPVRAEAESQPDPRNLRALYEDDVTAIDASDRLRPCPSR